jgi:TRAP-type C4-dicarboxylate transport system permease small subunit
MTAIGFVLFVVGWIVALYVWEPESPTESQIFFYAGAVMAFGFCIMCIGFAIWLWKTMP